MNEKAKLIDLVKQYIINSDIRNMTIDFLENKTPKYFLNFFYLFYHIKKDRHGQPTPYQQQKR